MASILTNYGALVALQNLEATQKSLTDTQNQISTGLKVGSAKDDASTWAISTQMKSNVSDLMQVSTNLGNADSSLGVAVAGTNAIASLISQISAKVTAAQDPTADKSTIQNDINQLVSQINSTATSASFNGVNLIDGATSQANFLASVNATGNGSNSPTYINVGGINLQTSGSLLSTLGGINVTSSLNGNTVTTTTNANDTLTIGQTSLGAGDSFTFNYSTNNGATSGTVTLVGSNDMSGTVESEANGNYVVAVNLTAANAAAVAGGATAVLQEGGLATYVNSVLTGTNAQAANASYAGWNDANGAVAAANVPFAAAATATRGGASVTNNVLTVTQATTAPSTASVGTVASGYSVLLGQLTTAQNAVIAASAEFGSAQSRVEMQQTFVNNLVTSLQNGIGNMIDADMSTESARLTALQVQQQLGTQALSIANQAPQSILSLFK